MKDVPSVVFGSKHHYVIVDHSQPDKRCLLMVLCSLDFHWRLLSEDWMHDHVCSWGYRFITRLTFSSTSTRPEFSLYLLCSTGPKSQRDDIQQCKYEPGNSRS